VRKRRISPPPQQKNKKADFKNFFWKQEKKATNE